MKTILKISMLLVAAVLVFSSCEKSMKSVLLSGNNWIIEESDEVKEVANKQVLRFINSDTISIDDENRFYISWVDEYTFRLSLILPKIRATG